MKNGWNQIKIYWATERLNKSRTKRKGRKTKRIFNLSNESKAAFKGSLKKTLTLNNLKDNFSMRITTRLENEGNFENL